MPEKLEREEWVDVFRGLAVFMVVLGHLYKGYSFHLIANPVKMPVFYLLAGYVASLNRSVYRVMINRACTLFIPMIVFSLFPIRILYYLFILEDTTILSTYVRRFVDGSINWFIFSFFLSSILFACLWKIAKKNHVVFGIESLICFVIGILTRDVPFMKIWSFNTALTSILFMFIGYELRVHRWEWANNKRLVFLCAIIYILLIWISRTVYSGKTINFHLCSYYSVSICIILVLTGFVFLRYWIVKFCSRNTGVLKLFFVSFGQNTIVVYLASATFNAVVLTFFRAFLGTESPHFFVCFAGAVVSCLSGYFLSILCRRYIPLFLGILEGPKKHP